jgi:hypothetical protein
MPFVIHVNRVISHYSRHGHAMWATMLAKKLVNYVNMDNYILVKTTNNLVAMDVPCGQPCQLIN